MGFINLDPLEEALLGLDVAQALLDKAREDFKNNPDLLNKYEVISLEAIASYEKEIKLLRELAASVKLAQEYDKELDQLKGELNE